MIKRSQARKKKLLRILPITSLNIKADNKLQSKSKALRHFKVDPVLKIDETFHKQAESMFRYGADVLQGNGELPPMCFNHFNAV